MVRCAPSRDGQGPIDPFMQGRIRGIQYAVQDISTKQIYKNESAGQHENGPLRHREIRGQDRALPPTDRHAGPRERSSRSPPRHPADTPPADPINVTTGINAFRNPCAHHHTHFAQTLRPRRAHMLRPQHIQHRRPRHPRHRADETAPQGQRRQRDRHARPVRPSITDRPAP